MTAEDYALENMQGTDLQEIEMALQGFAKMKCKELLEIVAEKAKIKDFGYAVSRDSIINAVNLDEFIK